MYSKVFVLIFALPLPLTVTFYFSIIYSVSSMVSGILSWLAIIITSDRLSVDGQDRINLVFDHVFIIN